MKTIYSSFACLPILFLFFFQTGCDREQIPGELGSQQLLSIEFPNQATRLDFIYDDQDTLRRIEGILPGEGENALEFHYENGQVEYMPNWRVSSPTEEFISRTFSWNRWNSGQTMTLSVYPSLITWYNYDDTWYLYSRSLQTFPDSITWSDFFAQRSLSCQWDASQNQLSAIAKKRVNTQNGWQYLPTDTSYLFHFDNSLNPRQFQLRVRNPTSLLETISPNNLVSVDTIFPDLRVNSFVRTIEYDDQNRPVVLSYEQDGELIREEWTYRR